LATIERISSAGRFAELEQQWKELVDVSESSSPFLTWAWLHAWWTHLGPPRRLAIAAVWQSDRLIAIAPFAVSRAGLAWSGRYEFLGTGHAGSDYLDVIVRRGEEEDAVSALAECLSGDGLSLSLAHTPENSMASRLASTLFGHGWTMRQTVDGVCPVLQLGGHTWETFLLSLGSSHAATARRKMSVLKRRFALQLVQATDDEHRARLLEQLFSFHEARWSGGRGSTAFASSSLRAFHHDATCQALRSGWLRLYGLRLNDRIAAVMYAFVWKRRTYFYQHGFDPEFRQYGVGSVLMNLTIQRAIDEGALEFDMLYGQEPYKAFWRPVTRPLTRVELYAPRLSGRIYFHAVRMERAMRAIARQVLSPDAS
jgi:CelD/BcsL family acetyltransferase involved in cellulose biosynthesis